MRKILITTTDTLSGWEIDNYIKPVFASAVIGGGLFADFSASISDVFGGRSGRYEKKLQVIKEEAIASLTYKATELGANCILGLKIDVDEVSGKNMQLFMVTATGMAVIARSVRNYDSGIGVKGIDKEHVREKANIIKLAKKFQSPETVIKVEELQTIVQSRSSSFKEFIMGKLKKMFQDSQYNDPALSEYLKLYKEYFMVIDPPDAMGILYPELASGTTGPLLNILVGIINDGDLVNFDYINQLLDGDLKQRKLGLNLLAAHKPSYSSDDIVVIKQMIEKVKVSFPKIVSIGAKKGFLSSTEKEVWICPCGGSNPIEDERCSKCGQDQFGFRSNEFTPEDIVRGLTNRVEALESLL